MQHTAWQSAPPLELYQRLHAGKQQEAQDEGCAAAPDHATSQQRDSKAAKHAAAGSEPASSEPSQYYVNTEGTLLSEFGTFLGNLADKIDEEVNR